MRAHCFIVRLSLTYLAVHRRRLGVSPKGLSFSVFLVFILCLLEANYQRREYAKAYAVEEQRPLADMYASHFSIQPRS